MLVWTLLDVTEVDAMMMRVSEEDSVTEPFGTVVVASSW
jgi:hypothetical protein